MPTTNGYGSTNNADFVGEADDNIKLSSQLVHGCRRRVHGYDSLFASPYWRNLQLKSIICAGESSSYLKENFVNRIHIGFLFL